MEAVVWDEPPKNATMIPFERPLIDLLRRLTHGDEPPQDMIAAENETIAANLLVITYLVEDGTRKWIFGEYRDSDDVLLHAIQVPIRTPELEPGEPMELWLFRNRFELARVYEGLRRENAGSAIPLPTLRSRAGYLACFLTAPHRAV